jgi:hypothetical protein
MRTGVDARAYMFSFAIPVSGPIPKERLAPHRHRKLRGVIQKLSPV